MILIQDTTNPNNKDNDTLIFAVPVHATVWAFWVEQARKDGSFEGDMPYVMTKPEGEQGVMIMLPEPSQDDDYACFIAAKIRLVRDFTGRIYVVRGTHNTWTKAQVQYAIMGGDPNVMLEVDEKLT